MELNFELIFFSGHDVVSYGLLDKIGREERGHIPIYCPFSLLLHSHLPK